MVTEEPCPTHKDTECDKCDYYKIIMRPFDREESIYRMWVGDSASLSFGPMGMEDDVSILYVSPL